MLPMPRIFDDALDLILLRPRPLPHYQYPVWQPLLLVAVVGAVGGASVDTFVGNAVARLGFFMTLNIGLTLVLAQFFRIWMSQIGWDGKGDVLALIAVADGIGFVRPLADWLPDPLDDVAQLALACYSLVILWYSLSQSTGLRRGHIAMGVLLAVPLVILIQVLAWSLAVQAGWMVMPAKG